MRRCLSVAGLFLAVLLVLPTAVRAADAPYAGTWKVLYLPPGQEQALFLLKVEHHAIGPKLALVAVGQANFEGMPLQDAKAQQGALRFTAALPGLPLKFVAYSPSGEATPKEMLGSMELRGTRFPVRFERSTDKDLDPKTAGKRLDGLTDYLKAVRSKDTDEKKATLQALLDTKPPSAFAYYVTLELAGTLAAGGAEESAVKAAADKALELATGYGPELRADTVSQLAQRLTAAKKAPALAVTYARAAEKALPAEAPPAQQVAVLKTLAAALKQAQQEAEAKAVGDRLAKLDKLLDDEYFKNAVPFATKKFARTNPGRVALVELFTGAQCPPCVAADVAFDAALKTYQPGDVVLLQYHLHIPGPDPLTNPDTDKRSSYYSVRGVPSTYVGGGDDLGIGGPKGRGEDSFSALAAAIRKELDKSITAKLKLTAKQVGDEIAIIAEVEALKDAGADAKLRLALVEESVRYPGRNGQRFHHQVVRAMPGGADGFTLKGPQQTHEAKVNLAELKRSLATYLDQANDLRPFLDDERPLQLDHLSVVGFVQNDQTKEVLQAIQVEIQRQK